MTGLEKDNIYNVHRQHYKTAKSESNRKIARKTNIAQWLRNQPEGSLQH